MRPVEDSIRRSIGPGTVLSTPTGRGRFTCAELDSRGIVLLLGKKEARTRIPWDALEGIPKFLEGRGSVEIGSVFSTDANPESLDGYLKAYINRATAAWVAVVLETAGVVNIDRRVPACVRLAPPATEATT